MLVKKSERKVNMQGIKNNGRLIRFESWLNGHVDQVAFFIIVSGFFVYIYYVTGYYLNPDEAFNYLVANQLTGLSAWKALLKSAGYDPAHPPLYVFVLHLCSKLWNSIFALRFLSAALGAAALWFAFKWIQRTYGSLEAIIGLIFLSFAPGMVSIACELRDYTLLLFFICGALYFLQRFLEEESLWSGIVWSIFLYGAILAHFTAVWIVITLGIYMAFLLLLKKPGWRVAALWGVSQTGVVALYGFLYITHIKSMLNSGYAEFHIQGYLKRYYFSPGEETLTSFVTRNSMDFFAYVTGGKLAGIIALVCFLLGIVSILLKRSPKFVYKDRWYNAILLVLPFIIGCMGAVFRVMPYGGCRHSSYLLPFASTAIALCLVRVLSLKRMSVALMAGMILVPLWLAGWHPPNANPGMSNVHMKAALEQINEVVPTDEIFFVDNMTRSVLAHYLARDQRPLISSKHGAIDEVQMGKFHVASADTFAFSPSNFESELLTMSRSFDIEDGDFVWVMTVGWGGAKQFNAFLAAYPQERIKEHWNFGPITLFQISIPPGATLQ